MEAMHIYFEEEKMKRKFFRWLYIFSATHLVGNRQVIKKIVITKQVTRDLLKEAEYYHDLLDVVKIELLKSLAISLEPYVQIKSENLSPGTDGIKYQLAIYVIGEK